MSYETELYTLNYWIAFCSGYTVAILLHTRWMCTEWKQAIVEDWYYVYEILFWNDIWLEIR